MSSTLSLSVSPTLIFKPQNLSKDINLTKSNNKETPSQQTLLVTKVTKRKLLTSSVIGLGQACVGLSAAQPTKAEPESPIASTSSRISYTRFLQYLDEGVVKKVDLLENGTVAIAEIYNQTLDKIQRVKIQLPGLPKELVRKMEDKNVDFGVYPMDVNWGDAILDLLGNLAFPLILIGSLLLRSSRNNPVGGPNLPFGLGRNKAKFEMEPNTGVTFDDVAGRGTGIGGGNDEREQTLNQLLTEMDGFSGNTGVIVIAATNRPEILDSALLRPGRFDRQVTVGLPDIRGREEILKVHSNNKKLDKDISLNIIAMRTPGFSGADLANLMNEAAILAGRRRKEKITMKEIDDSIDRIVAGMEGTKMTDGKSKILVAYHEVGHAICAMSCHTDNDSHVTSAWLATYADVTCESLFTGQDMLTTLTPGHDPVQKVTLVPRGQAKGLTWFIPSEDPSLISKNQLFARIVGGLGGRAAEEIIFGETEITTGAAGDLQQITQIARQMVTMYGMSEIGPWTLTDPTTQTSDVVLRMLARNSMSEKLAEDIDNSKHKKEMKNVKQLGWNVRLCEQPSNN
ncbi:hypothetical protein TSUD_169810 [Trifolium subterraneum]|nr:hypothetical protein TSUD_169810 [Trifolium subterraneum]